MKKKLAILFILILIAGYYLAMLCTTNSVVEDFYNVVNNNMDENISYEELKRYKVPSFENTTYKNTDTKINRIFVVHNFNKGIMYVKYSYIMYDINGHTISGSSNVYSKWSIEKVGKRWTVVDIEEKP